MGVSKFTRPLQLDGSMALDGFASGQEFVDGWLAKHARHAKARGSAVVYVSHRAGPDPVTEPPAGFYTLSSASVERDLIGGGWLKRNAPAQVPVILLGVLGVDARYHGNGLGKMLLNDASRRAVAIADSLGAKALVVDPADEGAAAFYARFGFERIPGMSRMFMPLARQGGR